jgi:hypothetical protein
VGYCDSHELQGERNETRRSGPELAESDQFCVRPPDFSISYPESRDFQKFPWIIRVRFHDIFRSRTISYSCSKRPWSLFVGLFLVLGVLGPLLPFLFGRIMIIDTFIRVRAAGSPLSFAFLTFEQNQRKEYREVLISGDLSQDDVGRATDQLGAFQVSRR